MVPVTPTGRSCDYWGMRVALLYEHPEWTSALSAAIVERGLDLTGFDVGDLSFDPSTPPSGFDVYFIASP